MKKFLRKKNDYQEEPKMEKPTPPTKTHNEKNLQEQNVYSFFDTVQKPCISAISSCVRALTNAKITRRKLRNVDERMIFTKRGKLLV